MKNKNISFMTQAAMIAAIYVVLTYVFAPFSFGEVQVRISEALTILPVFTPAAIPGLFIGCLIGNILGGAIHYLWKYRNINWSILYMEASREESLPCPGSTDYCKYPDRSVRSALRIRSCTSNSIYDVHSWYRRDYFLCSTRNGSLLCT